MNVVSYILCYIKGSPDCGILLQTSTDSIFCIIVIIIGDLVHSLDVLGLDIVMTLEELCHMFKNQKTNDYLEILYRG